MMTTKFQRTFTCDRCGDSGTYLLNSHYDRPDGWFALRGRHTDRHRPMREKHFCQECFEELFGYDGIAWASYVEDEDEEIVWYEDEEDEPAPTTPAEALAHHDDLPDEIQERLSHSDDEDEEVNRFFMYGHDEPFLTVTIHADGTSTVERNEEELAELRANPVTVAEALEKVETEDWKTESLDMSDFKSIGEIKGDLKITRQGGYFGIVEDNDDDLFVGLTD